MNHAAPYKSDNWTSLLNSFLIMAIDFSFVIPHKVQVTECNTKSLDQLNTEHYYIGGCVNV